MSTKASEHPGISREPFITPEPEALTVEVEEAVPYRHTLTVTPDLAGPDPTQGELTMNDKPETITLYVTEVVQSRVTVVVTADMMDAAESLGYPRSPAGVAAWLADNPDRDDRVADGAADPKNFLGVVDRDVTEWEVG